MVSIDLLPFYLMFAIPAAIAVLVLLSMLAESRRGHESPTSQPAAKSARWRAYRANGPSAIPETSTASDL